MNCLHDLKCVVLGIENSTSNTPVVIPSSVDVVRTFFVRESCCEARSFSVWAGTNVRGHIKFWKKKKKCKHHWYG